VSSRVAPTLGWPFGSTSMLLPSRMFGVALCRGPFVASSVR
jgi:hypothetical protein